MIKGKTKTGFEFEIEEKKLDNMELIDAIKARHSCKCLLNLAKD